MKPTFGMEGTKDCGMVIEDPREEKKRPKLAKYLAASLVGLVTVAGIVVLSVYIGTRISKGAYEGALRKYSDGDGRQVEEMITQKQDEVLVDVPNSVHMVYDYKHGLVFRRYTDMNTKKRGPCYAAYIGEMDPKPDTQFAEEGQMPAPTGEPEIKQQWRFTDNKVPSNLASSTNVQNMCQDTDIFWMEKTADTGLEKREDYVLVYIGSVYYDAIYNGVAGRLEARYYDVFNVNGEFQFVYYELWFTAY
ncbi:hypothetical protein MAR_026857 [Mya arenaria]|uniref:Uncharacterized protein n=1 Tax=Mya arenaria TaxID=6604 RepID=A0ABY7ETX5_MYAAR|nr:uncharacterized protein LOC128243650 [Mya arenaria]WAR12677.1 hypothetical protein MAR_026857 [Mya arenaria]